VALKTLTTVYEEILTSLGCEIVDGHVLYPGPAESKPVLVDGMPLVIPIKEIRNSAKVRDYQAFHPLSESITLGESPVIKRLKELVVFHLNTTLGVALLDILGVCVDKTRHSTLTPDQLALMSMIPEVDQKTVDLFRNLMAKVTPGGEHQLITIYLKRKAEINGHTYNRGAMIAFPIIQELSKPDSKQVFGIDVRKKDKATLRALFDWILPEASTELYSRGSNSDVAPYFDSLMKTYLLVQHYVNAGIRMFATHTELGKELITETPWKDDLDNLSRYVGHLPPMVGNEGVKPSELQRAAASTPTPSALMPKPPAPQAPPTERPRDTDPEERKSEPKPQTYRDNPGSGNELQDWAREQQRNNGRRPPFAGRDRDDRRDYRDTRDDRDRRREPEPLFGPNREQRREEEQRRDREEDRYRRREYREDRYDRARGRDDYRDDRRRGDYDRGGRYSRRDVI
jgi:hypothetical protein